MTNLKLQPLSYVNVCKFNNLFLFIFHSHIAKMGNFGNKKRNKNRHKKVDIETKSEEKSLEEPDQSEKKEDTNNNIRHSYVGLYKNDVEKDLDDIDKSEKLQDNELMDMDADMRLSRAVVEKDRRNDSFKVKLLSLGLRVHLRKFK